MAHCRYCGKEITWLKEGRRSIAIEGDGGKHECEQYTSARKSLKKINRSDMDPDLIKQYEEAMNKKK